MTTALMHDLDSRFFRPLRARYPMTHDIPNHWLVLGAGSSATGLFSALGGMDYIAISGGIIGIATALATAVSFMIVKVGEARIQVDRERLVLDKERAVAFDGMFSEKLTHVSEQLDDAKTDADNAKQAADMQKGLNAQLALTIQEMKVRVEAANAKLHMIRNEAGAAELKHTAEANGLKDQIQGLQKQLADSNEQLRKLRDENARLNRIVQATAQTTVENKAAIAETNAKVDRMSHDSGSFPVYVDPAKPTEEMPKFDVRSPDGSK